MRPDQLFPYPSSNLRLTHIAAGIDELEELHACCQSSNTIADGLSSTWCPGADAAARLANLKADEKQTYWKEYNPPYFGASLNSRTWGASLLSGIPYPFTVISEDVDYFESTFLNNTGTIEYLFVTGVTNMSNGYAVFRAGTTTIYDGMVISVTGGSFDLGEINLTALQYPPATPVYFSFSFRIKKAGYPQYSEECQILGYVEQQ